jgi:hypothetical protein
MGLPRNWNGIFSLEYAESCASMQGKERIKIQCTHTTAMNKKKRQTNFW